MKMNAKLLLATLLSVAWLVPVTSLPAAEPMPVSAEISTIVAGKSPKDVVVTDAATLARLEAFFPGYRTAKASNAGSWKPSHIITFHYADGSTMKVLENDDDKVWSNGNGDLSIHGDFAPFFAGLK